MFPSSYKTGTITLTNGATTCDGAGGTLWTSLVDGDELYVFGAGQDTYPYEIQVNTDNSITLDRNYAGAGGAGLSYVILRRSVSRDSAAFVSKQIGDILSIYRNMINIAGNDQYLTFDKVGAGDNAGIWLKQGGVSKVRVGLFGDDDCHFQYLVGATWTSALTINSTSGAITLPGGLDASSLTGTVASARLTGAYTGITSLGTLTSDLTVGDGSAIRALFINGNATGTAGGGFLAIKNGGTGLLYFGGKSAVLGGTYDATPTIYSPNTIAITNGLTIGGTLGITGNTTVGGTLGITGATTAAALTASGLITANAGLKVSGAQAQIGAQAQTLSQTTAYLSVRGSATQNALEWGHNTAGYLATLGVQSASNLPFLCFLGEGGTNANTFRTLGVKCSIILPDGAGGFVFANVGSASADNQTASTLITISGAGALDAITLKQGGTAIGSAAFLTGGTAANNALKIGADGKLPVIDGSNLTGIIAVPASVDRQNVALALVYQSKSFLGYRRVINQFADGFTSTNGIDASSTNYSANTAAGLVSPTTITSSTGTYGQANATPRAGGSTSGNCGFLFTAPASAPLTSVVWSFASVTTAGSCNVQIYTNASGSPGTLLATSNSVAAAVGDNTYTFSSPVNMTSGTLYWVVLDPLSTCAVSVNTTTNQAGYGSGRNVTTASIVDDNINGLAEDWRVQINYTSGYNNMSLVTVPQTVSAAVANGRVLIEYDDTAVLTLNTDITAEITCNGGTNWTAVTLSFAGLGQGGYKVAESNDVIAGVSGTSFAARVKSFGKSTPLRGVSVTVH